MGHSVLAVRVLNNIFVCVARTHGISAWSMTRIIPFAPSTLNETRPYAVRAVVVSITQVGYNNGQLRKEDNESKKNMAKHLCLQVSGIEY